MQITLSSQQSKALEALSRQGGYTSLEDAIDTALLLLADEVTSHSSTESPEYLAWAEQTRQKIEEGVSAVNQGAVLDAADVLAQLREKVKAARSASV
jgi:antitoxin ParD1/3/4